MEASIDITLKLMNAEYHVIASGILPIYIDNENKEYVEGSLNGISVINNDVVLANVGLQKFVDKDDIYASIVLQDTVDYDIIAAVSFGLPVLTVDNLDKAMLEKMSVSQNMETGRNIERATTYVLKGTDSSGFSGTTISGNGQRIKAYYNTSASRVAIGVTSYTKNVNDYYEKNASSLDTVTTGVSKFSISLSRTGSDNSYIAGIEKNDGYDQNQNGVAKAVLQIFKDAFSALGFPSTLVENFFPGTSATVTVDTTYSTVKGVTVKAGDRLFNMDNTSYCAPVIFQMQKNGAKTGYYKGSSTIMTYQTMYMEASGVLTSYYTSAKTATIDFTI